MGLDLFGCLHGLLFFLESAGPNRSEFSARASKAICDHAAALTSS